MLTSDELITKRILHRNGTHLSMSGDTPFARAKLARAIGLDGEGEAVEEMLRGTYTLDDTGMDELHASEEMKNFLDDLKIPISGETHGTTPSLDV